MTNDDRQPELEVTLRRRLASAVPPAPSVTGWAERAVARARKRKARRRQALAVVSASCVAAAIAIAATSFGGNGDNPAPPDADREPVIAATPQPPEGLRYVGINNVVVAVPNDWDLRIGGCYDLTYENAVVIPSRSWLTCAPTRQQPDVSLLRILSTDDGNAEGLLENARPAGKINGIRVLRTPTEAFAGRATSALVVPDANAIFWLEAPSTKAIEQAFDTLTQLPDDYVALPSAQAPWPCVRDRLKAAGVTAKIQEDDHSRLLPGDIIRSQPALGTVAERGITVTLTVPAGGSDACEPPQTSPGQ